jgi:phosphate transport system protein
MNQPRSFDVALQELQRAIVVMGEVVEQILALAVKGIQHPMVQYRHEAGIIEERIDEMEIEIEERCNQLIVLQSPMGRDLRFLISTTRVASELERIADLAESVVKRSDFISRHHLVRNPPELQTLGELAQLMVHQSLESLVSGKVEMARTIHDEEIQADALTKECYAFIQAAMEGSRSDIVAYTHLLRAVGHLEHIADISGTIAGEAVYIYRGLFIRHQPHHNLGEPL